MTTDDFLLDQADREQRHQIRRRRDGRSKRRQLYAFGGIGVMFALVLGAPSLVSHSSVGRSIVVKSLADHGLEADVEMVRIGWMTPLRLTGLKINGASGSQLAIDQLDMDLIVSDLMGSPTDFGEIALRGVAVACSMADGKCNLEDDFRSFLEPSGNSRTPNASLKLQDISVAVEDAVTGQTWRLTQSSADVVVGSDRIEATFAGVLSEPGGSGGSIQGSVEIAEPALQDSQHALQNSVNQWHMDIACESLPLSVVSLLRRRFPESATSIPGRVTGDATGAVHLAGTAEGTVEATVENLNIRNLTAADEGSSIWRNELATLDGTLVLEGNRVIGRQLQASTDFATAKIDGAFSRTFSLTGTHDNPLRWLEAIDGTATAEIDLAAFERSLPGLLPLRDGVQLVSGRVVARVDSVPNGEVRRSQLHVRSEAIRARSRDRDVTLEPIELSATVSSDHGQLRAERFEWQSSFGSAVGQGDLRAGNADFEIDFGRITTMLRPIIEISEATLAGQAKGNVQWSVSDDNAWLLSGSGDASNLRVTLANGQSLTRSSLHGSVVAEGRWGGKSLQELSKAKFTVASRGLDLRTELMEPVKDPSATTPMPIRMRAEGRIETVAEILGPWLPTQWHGSSGGFLVNAEGSVSRQESRVTNAAIELTQPTVVYQDRHYQQPVIKVHFDGDYVLPSQSLHARSISVVGDAFSVAATGDVTGEQIAMDIKWRAKLERLQGSVHSQLADAPQSHSQPTIQQVGYQPAGVTGTEGFIDNWLVKGDCDGAITLRSHGNILNIDIDATGKNLALFQPAKESESHQMVGPMPVGRDRSGRNRSGRNQSGRNQSGRNQSGRNQSGRAPNSDGSQAVWLEPNLKIDGRLRYDRSTGNMAAESMQLAGDWFATTLSGAIAWNASRKDIQLAGPSRLKMNEVATRLSSLAGIEIQAEGIQETPLNVRLFERNDGEFGLQVAANLGWESGQIAGLQFGAATIPVLLSETSVEITPTRVPVSQGHLNVAGTVHFRPGPLWMQLEPGVAAESIRLTPEMTDRWLKYVAPLAAEATRVEGTIGAEIDKGVIVFGQPELSHVIGRLNVGGVEMNAGPLATQLLSSVDQIRALSSGATAATPDRTNQNLISMLVQTVDISVDQGIVSHERLYFQVDRAQVVTSGRVAFDGQLDMIAQVPLDASWLGSNLQGLAGRVVTLPVDGTISRPSLDSRGVQQVVTQLGVQAVQSTAEGYIQQQLNKSIDKLFGR